MKKHIRVVCAAGAAATVTVEGGGEARQLMRHGEATHDNGRCGSGGALPPCPYRHALRQCV